jgi:hypothetical protein
MLTVGRTLKLWRSVSRRVSFLSAWWYSRAVHQTHFTARTVKVGVFVVGVQNSEEEFAEGKHAEQARSA